MSVFYNLCILLGVKTITANSCYNVQSQNTFGAWDLYHIYKQILNFKRHNQIQRLSLITHKNYTDTFILQ